MINSMYFPKNDIIDDFSQNVIDIFVKHESTIDSLRETNRENTLSAKEVINVISNDLIRNNFSIGENKISIDSINNNKFYFNANAYNNKEKYVIQVEAGRAVMNNEFIKDFFEASLMSNVEYLCVAVKNNYRGHNDFEHVCNYFSKIYDSSKINIKLIGLLIIGY